MFSTCHPRYAPWRGIFVVMRFPLFILCGLICTVAVPPAAYAAIPEPFIDDLPFLALPSIPGAPYGTYQTALRTGNSLIFQVDVHSSKASAPVVSIDLSAFGIAGPTTLIADPAGASHHVVDFVDYYPNYHYDFGPRVVTGDISDGVKEIAVTATDSEGAVATATARIAVDNVAPTISLADLTFSVSPPAQGDTMYLSGRVDGTGSAVRVFSINETLLDADGRPLYAAPFGITMAYDTTALAGAIAASPDGSFTNVPMTLFEGGDIGQIARAASFKLAITVYDEAGNMATTARTVPLHPTPSTPPVSNVLFLPGTEASRLYSRDALGVEHQVWEPDFATDIAYLAMQADGTSRYALYTKDIVDRMQAHNALESQIARIFGVNLDVYKGFQSFMDGLVADGTLKEWRAYPYDWRYDVTDVVQQGTPTEVADGSVRQVYLANIVREMASSSPSGKVTLIGHSNGGLLAKALASALGADASRYIDRIIMVGTPQWGTPAAVGALLHADNFSDAPSMVISSVAARAVERDMGDPYDLLPSATYFSHVADPVATFSTTGLPSGEFATSFGTALTSFSILARFLEDTAGLDARAGGGLYAPLALRTDIVNKAAATHALLDAWTPPAGIAVTAIAGWGQDTIKTLAYTSGSRTVCGSQGLFLPYACAQAPELRHTPVTTQDGDGTVVSPSAIGTIGERLYFNAARFRDEGHGNFIHQNITSVSPIQDFLRTLIISATSNTIPYIVASRPLEGANPITRISSHSPVNLVVTDAQGRQSGLVPIPGTDFSGTLQDIPGSSVHILDDEQYIDVPQSASYQVVATGYAEGSATLQVETVGEGGVVNTTALFTSIPTAQNSTATFTVASGIATSPLVDTNGDGTTDFTAISVSPATSPLAYLRHMQEVVIAMPLDKGLARQLKAKLTNLEHLLKKDEKWDDEDDDGHDHPRRGERLDARIARKLDQLASYVERQAALAAKPPKGKKDNTQKGLPAASAEIILDMITELKTLRI